MEDPTSDANTIEASTQADSAGKRYSSSERAAQIKRIDAEVDAYRTSEENWIDQSYIQVQTILIAISGAIFGLSSAFVANIIGVRPLSHLIDLIWGWGCLLSCIVLILVSITCSRHGSKCYVDMMLRQRDEQLSEMDEDTKKAKIFKAAAGKSESWGDLLSRLSGWAGHIAVLAFVSGLLLIFVFTSTNLVNAQKGFIHDGSGQTNSNGPKNTDHHQGIHGSTSSQTKVTATTAATKRQPVIRSKHHTAQH